MLNLNQTTKPGRYIGQEYNAVIKRKEDVDTRIALIFPDVYEVGMSHLGLHILYHILNRSPKVWAERAYAPWPDMEEQLRRGRQPLSSLESGTPLAEFDILGITLPYEMCYTNILNILDLAGIPLSAAQRGPEFPLVIGGGACAFNPEPLADFFDAFFLGDGEEGILEIAEVYQQWKVSGKNKAELYSKLSEISGLYIPSFFAPRYNGAGELCGITPLKPGYSHVTRRRLESLDLADYPAKPVVPYIEIVHDRLTMEIARGCNRGCRYCQAGMVYRPARERSPEKIDCLVCNALKNSGYDEISLASLSTGDYSRLDDLLIRLNNVADRRISISLPSLRPGTLRPEMIDRIRQGRKTGFTIAPEAGTPRLRAVINKNISHQQILDTTRLVFESGWESLKLYFMIGLPTEGQEDLAGIVELVNELKVLARKIRRGYNFNITLTGFVPKAHTPFQWAAMDSMESLLGKQAFLQEKLAGPRVQLKWQDPRVSFVEGLLARGDRRIGSVLRRVWESGGRFEGWSEHFRLSYWQEALAYAGVDPAHYLTRPRTAGEVFPWEHLQTGVSRDYLWREYGAAGMAEVTPDCRINGCHGCGLACRVTEKPASQAEGVQAVSSDRELPRETGTSYKLRVRFCKLGQVKFISHLDLGRAILRAMYRADMPLAYSQGFHPRPRISFGSGLPVGVESLAEYMDVELSAPLEAAGFVERLNRQLPPGLKILVAEYLPERHVSIVGQSHFFNYQVGLPIDSSDPSYRDSLSRLQAFMASESQLVPVATKSGVQIKEVRPLVNRLELIPLNGHLQLRLCLTSGVRPQEIIQHLYNIDPVELKTLNIMRTEVYDRNMSPILRSNFDAAGDISQFQ